MTWHNELEPNEQVVSKYVFTERADGFEITAPNQNRTPTRVTCYPTYLEIERRPGRDGEVEPRHFGFYEYYALSRAVAEGLMAEWEPPERNEHWSGVRDWAVTQTARAIGKRVYAQWQRLIQGVDPTVLAVHRAIFAATRGTAALAMEEELYQYEFVVRDIVNYRAAAVAAKWVEPLADGCIQRRALNSPQAQDIRQALSALEPLARQSGLTLYSSLELDRTTAKHSSPIEAMQDWRALFSPTGEDYRSLNRTLTYLPGGIPATLLCRALRDLYLERPITQRLELLALLHYQEAAGKREDWVNLPVFMHTDTPGVKEAVRRVAAYMHDDLSTRKAADVRRAVGILADFPERHTGNIVGLADKSIRWHRDGQEHRTQETIDRLGGHTLTALPPSLPDIPGVTFLDNVEAVCREGAAMGHCIASYAAFAVNGACYLFHVEHNGETATVEVDPAGPAVQAHGPHNTNNGAVRWGQRALSRWGRQVAQLGPPQVRGTVQDDGEILF